MNSKIRTKIGVAFFEINTARHIEYVLNSNPLKTTSFELWNIFNGGS